MYEVSFGHRLPGPYLPFARVLRSDFFPMTHAANWQWMKLIPCGRGKRFAMFNDLSVAGLMW